MKNSADLWGDDDFEDWGELATEGTFETTMAQPSAPMAPEGMDDFMTGPSAPPVEGEGESNWERGTFMQPGSTRTKSIARQFGETTPIVVDDEDSWGADDDDMMGNTSGNNPGGMNDEIDDWGDLEDDHIFGGAEAENRVTAEVMEVVQTEINYLNLMSDKFCAGHSLTLPGNTVVNVIIGIKVCALKLSALQREIHGLKTSDRIVIKVKFSHLFMGGEKPEITQVGKISSGEELRWDTNASDFLFQWPLRDKIQNLFINSTWPPENLLHVDQHLVTIVNTTAQPLFKCVETYEACQKNLHRTLDVLFKQADIPEPEMEPGAEIQPENQNNSFFSNFSVFRKRPNNISPPRKRIKRNKTFEQCIRELSEFGEKYDKKIRELKNLSQSCGISYYVLKSAWNALHRDTDELIKKCEQNPEFFIEFDSNKSSCPVKNHIQDLSHAIKSSYLSQIALFVAHVMNKAGQACMICDGELEYVGLKPSVCSKEHCQFAFGNLGLGFNLAHELTSQRIILDMYISMMLSSCVSGSINLCFPRGVRDATGKEDFLKNGKSNHTKLICVIRKLPSLSKLNEYLIEARNLSENMDNVTPNIYLRRQLDQNHVLLRPLLKWIITSNRAYLRLLEPDERFTEIGAHFQFFFANASPEKEARFQSLKREAEKYRGAGNGVIQAWHGSPFSNWHSIMRNGLKNYSGTENQQHGAAFGSGVYLAPNIRTSLRYSKRGFENHWSLSELGKELFGIALCEIVNHRDVPKPNPHYVISKDEWIMTRFFFLFTSHDEYKKAYDSRIEANSLTISPILRRLFDTI